MSSKRSITGWRQVKPERVPSKRRYLPLVSAKAAAPAASPEIDGDAEIAAKLKIQQ
jgi:hypothetical protein